MTSATGGRRRLFLHLGPMKSGTSYVQSMMTANADALAGAGVLFPLDDGAWHLQSRGIKQFRDPERESSPLDVRPPWEQLREVIHDHDGTSVVSMEFLSFYEKEEAERLVAEFPDHEVHIVLTLRDAARLVPSVWQSAGRNGKIVSWTEFVHALHTKGKSRPKAFFRHRQGVRGQLEAWVPAVPVEHVHVVTVPGRDKPRTELWDRFSGVIGVDPAIATSHPSAGNESLGYPSADLARRVNTLLGRQSRGAMRLATKRMLSRQELATRKDLEPPVPLDRRVMEFGAFWNGKTHATLEEYGVRVVGDLAELPLEPGEPMLELAEEPDPAAVLDAAEFAVTRIRVRCQGKVEAGVEPGPRTTALLAAPVPYRGAWESAADPLSAAAADVATGVTAYAELIAE